MRLLRTLCGVGVGFAALAGAPVAHAQSTFDHVLSGSRIEEGDHCAIVQVDFNFPVRYVSHFPVSAGDQLRIQVRAIDRANDAIEVNRESVRAPPSSVANVDSIVFDKDRQDGSTLTFLFSQLERFRVGQGSDFRSIRVAISDGVDEARCTPEAHPTRSDVIQTPTPQTTASAPLDVDVGAGDPLLAEARAAMTGGDNAHAVQLLTRILQDPNAPSARDAQELLGLARERAGQRAHARAEYEEYLRRYPSGDGTERVRQRLAGLLAEDLPERPALRQAERQTRGSGGHWNASASFSQTYFRDDATYTYEDQFAPTPTTTTDKINYQNELLTALDIDIARSGGAVSARLRVSGAYANDFSEGGVDEGSLSTAYFEIDDSKDRFTTRLGRQTRSTSGIFGRFDGATVAVKPLERVRLTVSAGSAVDSPRDLTFDPNRTFYAASLDYLGEGWDASVYRLQQKEMDFIDRDAVGAEFRYVSDAANIFTLADYDVHFMELNIALANGSFTLPGETTLNFGYDFRKAPLLASINALIGQTVGSLDELALTYSKQEIQQLALDRTAESKTYYLGLAHPFSDRFSFNVDATVSDFGATPESGGVMATEATGQEIYASAQIIGQGLFKDGDLGIIGVRYADTVSSKRYGFDLNTRYPVTRWLRVNPRLRVSVRENKNDDTKQLSARPSLRLNVQNGRHFALEADMGAEWQRTENSMMREESWDYFITAGYRLDF